MVRIYKIAEERKRSFISNLSLNSLFIILNLLFFIIFTVLIYLNVISIDFIAIKPSNILEGKYLWTFITSMFMHAGFFHLFVNLFSMFFAGSLIEKIIGRKRYLWFYLFSGLFANLFFVLFSLIIKSDFNTYAVGASGALFGLIGAMIFLTPNLPVYIMFIPIPIKIKYAAPGMLFILWIISIVGNIPIGNTAHLGGLIAGLVYGFYLKRKYKQKVRIINKYFI